MASEARKSTPPKGMELDERGALESALARAREEAEKQRRVNASLEEALRSRDAVLSVVAHALRNPLNIISIAANTLLQRSPNAAARRPIERIVRSARRADRMISDLLKISAIETGQFTVEREPVETADLVLGAIESQQGLAAEASVILGTDLSPERSE